jgi:kinesin family protein 1
MEHQLNMIQQQLKRLINARARGESGDVIRFEPVIYNAKQLRLIRKVLDRWRAHRSFSMAEAVLSNAVLVKEANVIRYVVTCII